MLFIMRNSLSKVLLVLCVAPACEPAHETGGGEKVSVDAPAGHDASAATEIVFSNDGHNTFEQPISLDNRGWHVFHMSKSAGSSYCIVLQTTDGDLDLYGHWIPIMDPNRVCDEPESDPMTCVQHRSDRPERTQDAVLIDATQDGDYWLWIYAYPRPEYSSGQGSLFATKLQEGSDCLPAE